jgi:hypothetical protein
MKVRYPGVNSTYHGPSWVIMGHHGVFLTDDYNAWFPEHTQLLGRAPLVVRPVRLHPHTRAARARQSVNTVSGTWFQLLCKRHAACAFTERTTSLGLLQG